MVNLSIQSKLKVKNADIICYLLTSLGFLQQGNVRKPEKLMNIVEIEVENLQIFWTSCEIPMKFSRKMLLTIIIKVTKNQDSSLSLKNTFSWKITETGAGEWGRGGQIYLLTSCFRINLEDFHKILKIPTFFQKCY